MHDLNARIAKNSRYPDNENPIAIRHREDYPEGYDFNGYDTVFDPVMKYLLDYEELVKSCPDEWNVFYAIRGVELLFDAFN